MKKCPGCGSLKFELVLYRATTIQEVKLNSNNNVEFTYPVISDYEDQELVCSECGKVAAVGRTKVDKFIWGH